MTDHKPQSQIERGKKELKKLLPVGFVVGEIDNDAAKVAMIYEGEVVWNKAMTDLQEGAHQRGLQD